MDEIPRRCACGISCRPRGSGQPLWNHAAVGPSDLLSVFVIRRPGSELPVRRTRKQPTAYAAGCMVPKGLRRGRELLGRFELYQILLNPVDLEAIAVPDYANL